MPNYPKDLGSKPYTQPTPSPRSKPDNIVPRPQPAPAPATVNPYQGHPSQPTDTGNGTPGREPARLPSVPTPSRPGVDTIPK